MSFRRLTAALVLLAGCIAPAVLRAEESAWCETQSAQFQLVSDLAAEEQLALLEKLKRLEALADPFLPGEPVSRRDPLKLVVFEQRKDFLALTGKRKFAGYMQPSLQTNRLLIGPIRGDLDETTLHEYAHYLLRNRSGVSLPMWFDEGLATLLGNTRLDADTAVIGTLPLERMERRISREAEILSPQQRLSRSLDATNLSQWRGDRINEFYDLAWLLVHYLYFDVYQADLIAGSIPASGLSQYLQAGDQPLTEHLNLRRSQLVRALEKHIDRWDQPEPVATIEPELAETTFRCLEPLERDLALALAVHMQSPEAARTLLAPYAEAADTLRPEQTVALQIASARIEMASDAPEAAAVLIESVLNVQSGQPEAITLSADLLISDCLFQRDEACRDKWQTAGSRYRQALRGDPSRYDAILGVGLAELHRGRAGDAANYLKVAYARAPWAAVINYYLGESYRLMGDSRARTYLENARSWAVQDIWRVLAEESLRLIAEADQASLSTR